MITFLRGNIIELHPTHAIIECNGIGYYLNISLNTFSKFEKKDLKSIQFYTYLSIKEDSYDNTEDDISEFAIFDEILTTGPMAVTEAKKLTLTFDRWNGTDEELRLWTLDKTSEMRGSEEGQEGGDGAAEDAAAPRDPHTRDRVPRRHRDDDDDQNGVDGHDDE